MATDQQMADQPAREKKAQQDFPGISYKFVYDEDMTPADRQRARQEQLQNVREQEELRQLLADQEKRLRQISQRQQLREEEKQKKSKEEVLADLIKKEADLREKEDDLRIDRKKMTEHRDKAASVVHHIDLLLEGLLYRYKDRGAFEGLRDDLARANYQLQEEFEQEIEALTQKERTVIDQQEETHHQRIRLAYAIEDEKLKQKKEKTI